MTEEHKPAKIVDAEIIEIQADNDDYLVGSQVPTPTKNTSSTTCNIDGGESEFLAASAESVRAKYGKADIFLTLVGFCILAIGGIIATLVIMLVGSFAGSFQWIATGLTGVCQALLATFAAVFFANPVFKWFHNSNPNAWKQEDKGAGTLGAAIGLAASVFLTPIGWVFFCLAAVIGGCVGLTIASAPPVIASVVVAIGTPIAIVPLTFLYIHFLAAILDSFE